MEERGDRVGCLWYTEWLCAGCCGTEEEGENCASYIPRVVRAEVEVKVDKQLKLFDIDEE